jgi:hypothetical protein
MKICYSAGINNKVAPSGKYHPKTQVEEVAEHVEFKKGLEPGKATCVEGKDCC